MTVAAAPTWLDEVTDADLRGAAVDGYRPGEQLRSLRTTRRLLAALWSEMVGRPQHHVALHDVLAAGGASSSSFYERFENIESLVLLTGSLLLDLDARRREVAPPGCEPDAPCPRGELVATATSELVESVLPPGGVPREVLATGVWNDDYVARRAVERAHRARHFALRVARADEPADPRAGGDRTYARALTYAHLVSALWEQAWMIGGLLLDPSWFERRVEHITLLGELLFDPRPELWERARVIEDTLDVRLAAPALEVRSARHLATVTELRDATRLALLEHGLALAPSEVAASVHRSPSAFFDTFGSVAGALADLATVHEIGVLPVVVFRPREAVGPADLVEHLAWRLRAWSDSRGLVGRRLLQAAGRHPAVAGVVHEQTMRSVELLVGWYAPMVALPPPLLRKVFFALLGLEHHQVLWGRLPDVVAGPAALGALLTPVLVPST